MFGVRCPTPTDTRGFTRADLVAVGAVVALLGLLLLPVFGDSERNSRAADDPTRARASSGLDAGRYVPRIRSYSMNTWIGGMAWNGPAWTLYTNLAQVTAAGPDQLWVLIGERPDSINDGLFIVDMTGYLTSPTQYRMVDFPAYYHGRGAMVGFADERAQVRIWRDIRTVPAGPILNSPQPNNLDILWLQERSTRKSN